MNARAAQTKVGRDCFFVTATKEIRTSKHVIEPGMYVCIDPGAKPSDDRMVLVGQNLERWNGQADIRGVMIATYVSEYTRKEAV